MQQATSKRLPALGAGVVPTALFRRIEWDRVVAALVAAVLLIVALGLPVWKMTLLAPQYPGGLHMTAYGDRFEGDVREINILNHYIGMKPIDQNDVPELNLFRPGLIVLAIVLLVLAVLPLPHWLKVVEGFAIWALPIGLVLDLQWWLYRYGHNLNPHAPLRMPAFTPHVVGTTKVMNFHNEASFGAGFWLLVAAALAISLLPSLLRALWELPRWFGAGAATAVLMAVLLTGGGRAQAAPARPVQQIADAIAQADPGATIHVAPGVYHGQLVIDKPIVLEGDGGAVIDGDGLGDVVVVKADDVEIHRFTIRDS